MATLDGVRRRWWLIVGAVILLALGIVFFPKMHYVDARPAASFGEQYFSELKQRQMDDAFALYTDGFLQKRGQDWRNTISQLDIQNGTITNFKTLTAQVAPVTLRDSTELACVLARYQVTRPKLVSEERLTICPHQRGDAYGIAGHEIVRSDNGEDLAAGLTFAEKTIYKYPHN